MCPGEIGVEIELRAGNGRYPYLDTRGGARAARFAVGATRAGRKVRFVLALLAGAGRAQFGTSPTETRGATRSRYYYYYQPPYNSQIALNPGISGRPSGAQFSGSSARRLGA